MMMMMNRGKEIRDVRVESFDFEIEFLSLSFVISPYLHLGRYGYSKCVVRESRMSVNRIRAKDAIGFGTSIGMDWTRGKRCLESSQRDRWGSSRGSSLSVVCQTRTSKTFSPGSSLSRLDRRVCLPSNLDVLPLIAVSTPRSEPRNAVASWRLNEDLGPRKQTRTEHATSTFNAFYG